MPEVVILHHTDVEDAGKKITDNLFPLYYK